MLRSKHDLFAMAERHEPLYLMACNQKGYLTDAELNTILAIQKKGASKTMKCPACYAGGLVWSPSTSESSIICKMCGHEYILQSYTMDKQKLEDESKTSDTAFCPFCKFKATELNKIQCNNAVTIHLQEHHKIADPMTTIPRLMMMEDHK